MRIHSTCMLMKIACWLNRSWNDEKFFLTRAGLIKRTLLT